MPALVLALLWERDVYRRYERGCDPLCRSRMLSVRGRPAEYSAPPELTRLRSEPSIKISFLRTIRDWGEFQKPARTRGQVCMQVALPYGRASDTQNPLPNGEGTGG